MCFYTLKKKKCCFYIHIYIEGVHHLAVLFKWTLWNVKPYILHSKYPTMHREQQQCRPSGIAQKEKWRPCERKDMTQKCTKLFLFCFRWYQVPAYWLIVHSYFLRHYGTNRSDWCWSGTFYLCKSDDVLNGTRKKMIKKSKFYCRRHQIPTRSETSLKPNQEIQMHFSSSPSLPGSPFSLSAKPRLTLYQCFMLVWFSMSNSCSKCFTAFMLRGSPPQGFEPLVPHAA